jgi:hypothetical protein
MPINRRAGGYASARGWSVASAVALVIFALLPLAALSAPGEQQAPTSTPNRTPTAKAGTPTVAATRTGKPLTGLILVPLGVQEAGPTPGNAADLTAIRGTVVDYNGVGLWGQVVKVTRGTAVLTATTNDAGFYEIDGLPAGTYSVVVDGQICTSADNLKPPIGRGLQVNFGQMRPAATPVQTTRTAGPTTPTVTRTPAAATAVAATPTASPTSQPTATPIGLSRWWSWVGIELNTSTLLSALFLGVMGGALFVVVGIVVGLIRR